MWTAKDETGNRYGRLVVLRRAEERKSGRVCWVCKCDCGNEAIVSGESLRNGCTRSCGCLRRERLKTLHERSGNKGKLIDETGHRYGRLLVLRKGSTTRSGAKWICKCDCGKYTEVYGISLRFGDAKSCGCLRRETARRNAIEKMEL